MTPYTILIPYDGSDSAAWLLRLACSVTGHSEGRIIVLAVTQVHRSLPLNRLPVFLDEKSYNALVHAEEQAAQLGTRIEGRLRHSYDAATTVLREARAIGARAIFLPLKGSRIPWLRPRLGRQARHVLHAAPCPVLLAYVPRESELFPARAVAEAERVLGHAR